MNIKTILISLITVGILQLAAPTVLAANSVDNSSTKEVVWIDVRSDLEHSLSHIDGDLHIPHSEIVAQTIKLVPNKDAEINLYCLSGGRAGKALNALKDSGYTNVNNLGGISDVREQRGLSK